MPWEDDTDFWDIDEFLWDECDKNGEPIMPPEPEPVYRIYTEWVEYAPGCKKLVTTKIEIEK